MTVIEAGRFVEAEKRRVQILNELKDYLTEAEGRDVKRDEFADLFSLALRTLELEHDVAATLLMTSRPTISRWVSGQSAPHHLGRPAVFRVLRKVTADRIKQLATRTGDLATQ